MSRKPKRQSKSTKISTNGRSLSSRPLEPHPSPVAQWYRGTNELPLSTFIKIWTNGDLKPLIISGEPSSDDLLTAWSNIYQQFLDGMQDKKAFYKVKLRNEIDKLDFDYRIIQAAIQRLSFGPSEWATEQLRRRVRVAGQFNPEDQATYYQELIVVLNHAQSLKHRRSEREAELNIIYGRQGSTSAPSDGQFDSLVAKVCMFVKFQINRKETMTSEFMEYYKEMKRQEEALEKQLQTSKSRRFAG